MKKNKKLTVLSISLFIFSSVFTTVYAEFSYTMTQRNSEGVLKHTVFDEFKTPEICAAGLAEKKKEYPNNTFDICTDNGITTSFGYRANSTFVEGFATIEFCTTDLIAAKKANPGWTYTNCTEVKSMKVITPSSTIEKKLPTLDIPTKVAPDKKAHPGDLGVYKLLAPIGKLTSINTSSNGTCPGNPDITNGVACYLNIIFKIGIGLAGALAVVMIVVASIQYMGDESVFGKTEAKGKIFSAILGLIIALAAYAILNTVNPDLTGSGGVTIDDVSFEIAGDTNAPIGSKNSLPSGILCIPGKSNIPAIAKSFENKMTYQMGAKGVAGPNNTIKLDCSGFVNYVLQCAGVPFINSGTSDIFKNAEKVTSINGNLVNNKNLAVGDLVGWRPNENPKAPTGRDFGHVMIYIGDGRVQTVADSHGKSPVGQALGIFQISKYQDRIKYIKRAP